jgi:hypothetical protein
MSITSNVSNIRYHFPASIGARALQPSTDKAAKPPQRRPPRKSGLYAVLHAAHAHGFTPPGEGEARG